MKPLLFLGLCSILSAPALCQQLPPSNDSLQSPKEIAMMKSNNRNTLGWVFLVGGGIMGIVGFSQAGKIAKDDNVGFREGFESGMGFTLMGFTGSTLALISLPLFVAAEKYKKQAIAISIVNEPILLVPLQGKPGIHQTALYLKISLGK